MAASIQKATTGLMVVAAVAILVIGLASESVVECSPRTEVFTNSFLVRFRRDMTRKEASSVANVHGFVNLGPVSTHHKQVRAVRTVRSAMAVKACDCK